ncbi:MAG: PhoH family protein [Pontiellaceae bacterium]|nr:PhoH family protein [Pontiellaceae bacterium]MBN2784441.1 PhoH family protein [Pontiellaceae bacterium]
MNSHTIHFDNASEAREITPLLEQLADRIHSRFGLELLARDLTINLQGPDEQAVPLIKFINDLRKTRNRTRIDNQAVSYAYEAFEQGEIDVFEKLASIRIDVGARKPSVFPKTLGQQIYLDAMLKSTITFGIGPAGTGKTYLAMAMAVSSLIKEEISRIILTRPAIEAGENLGFLPGDMQQKVAPYLRPLYDALYDMLPAETIESYLERGIIEVAPLAYMRGRTLNHAFVILDEAQNTTPPQMLMFLTRLGFDSKCAITGDLTQIDLPGRSASGLKEAQSILQNIHGLEIISLTERDVVRHPLVQKVIEAYQAKRNS